VTPGCLTYDAVIPTRNRPEALVLLTQTWPPERLIVIDSTDDHDRIVRPVMAAANPHGVKIVVRPSPKRMAQQRNLGLEMVEASVVFFPDDELLFYPDAADKIMAVYEEDTAQRIVGVCAAVAATPPSDTVLAEINQQSAKHVLLVRTILWQN